MTPEERQKVAEEAPSMTLILKVLHDTYPGFLPETLGGMATLVLVCHILEETHQKEAKDDLQDIIKRHMVLEKQRATEDVLKGSNQQN